MDSLIAILLENNYTLLHAYITLFLVTTLIDVTFLPTESPVDVYKRSILIDWIGTRPLLCGTDILFTICQAK